MKKIEQIVLAGGCFWCTEAVMQRIEGVLSVIPGYTGGTIKNPAYREVCTGRTGHAEGVALSYDTDKVSFQTLLEVFFATHDPTTLNRQGNDIGTQYRSEIFCSNEEQKKEAERFIQFLEQENVFEAPIVTKVSMLGPFYQAEEDHHDYYNLNKSQPYCTFIINPKIEKIKNYYSDKLKST